jgi:hypothetical protein
MTSRKSISCMLGMALMAVVCMPARAQVTVSSGTSSSSTVIHEKGTSRWKTSTGATDFNIEMRGRIEISDDDKDVRNISDDGYLEINKTVFGSKRAIVIEPLGGGKLKKEYYEGRTKMAWEPNGRGWLAEILPDIVRNTTIAAESRVNRIFKQGGTMAVLAEIEKINSDHVKSHYANLLMKHPVQAKDHPTVINTLAEEVDSDHYLSEFLRHNVAKFMQTRDGTTAVFSATRSIDSDHYTTEVINEALRNQSAAPEQVKIILQAASRMESDHYITEVLTSLLKQSNLSDAVISELVVTTNAIESDHYKSVVLIKALDKSGLSNTSYQRVIEAVKDIGSDHYLADVIRHLLDNKLTDEHLTLLLNISGSIDSDHYHAETIRTLIKRQTITDEQMGRLLDACNHIGSDHYKTEVMKEALKVSSITDGKVIAILNAVSQIDSDHYATDVLLTVAPRVKIGGSPLKDAYRSAARGIGSETYYGRALKAIE